MNEKINHQLPEQLPLNKFSHDITEIFEINESTAWVKNILTELETDRDDDALELAPELKIHLEVLRKNDHFLGDHLLVNADVSGHYHLPCGRCLHPLKQEVQLELKGAYLNEALEKSPEYEESTTVYAGGAEVELYFLKKGQAAFNDFIHEQLVSEMDPFPRCEGECQGQIYF